MVSLVNASLTSLCGRLRPAIAKIGSAEAEQPRKIAHD